MLPEQTKQRIEQEAQHRYSKHKEGLYKDNCVACYIAGATTEAERSAAWKAEATLLINKIHDWAEGDKTLPLGHSGNGWIAFSDKWNAFKRKLTNKP